MGKRGRSLSEMPGEFDENNAGAEEFRYNGHVHAWAGGGAAAGDGVKIQREGGDESNRVRRR